MSLLLIVVSSHFIVNNILEVRSLFAAIHVYVLIVLREMCTQGMIWFWLPASLVIMNDIAAYVCGKFVSSSSILSASGDSQGAMHCRYALWPTPAHQVVSEKDCRRFRRSFLRDCHLRCSSTYFSLSNNFDLLLTRDPRIVGYSLHALQFHDLPSSRPFDQRFLQHSMHSQPRIRMEELPSPWLSHRCYRTHRKSSQLHSQLTSLNH